MNDDSPAHPSLVTVAERMTRDVLTIVPSDSCQRALRMMHAAQINHLPVLDGNRLVGIITDRDVYRRSPQQAPIARGRAEKKLLALVNVGAVMTYRPITVHPSASLLEAVEVMLKHRVGCLPVLREGSLIGVLTTRDAIRFFIGSATESASEAGMANTSTSLDSPIRARPKRVSGGFAGTKQYPTTMEEG